MSDLDFVAKFEDHCECFALIREMWTLQLPGGICTAPFSNLRTNLDPNEQIRIQMNKFGSMWVHHKLVCGSQTSLP